MFSLLLMLYRKKPPAPSPYGQCCHIHIKAPHFVYIPAYCTKMRIDLTLQGCNFRLLILYLDGIFLPQLLLHALFLPIVILKFLYFLCLYPMHQKDCPCPDNHRTHTYPDYFSHVVPSRFTASVNSTASGILPASHRQPS